MKKLMILLMAAMIIPFAGCGLAQPYTNYPGAQEFAAGGAVNQEVKAIPVDGTSLRIEEESEVAVEIAISGSPIADSCAAFTDAQRAVYERLLGNLDGNPDLKQALTSLSGIEAADVHIKPVLFFGRGEQHAAAGLALTGAKDVQYTNNGNSYTIAYTSAEGAAVSLTGTWDAAADSLVCTGSRDGRENFYAEYRRTPYGYVGQYYLAHDNGASSLFVVTLKGGEGTFGISSVSGKPVALTGSEPSDYPACCDEWYAINGSTITGKMSDGTAINIECGNTEGD